MKAMVGFWRRNFLWCDLLLSLGLSAAFIAWSERLGGRDVLYQVLDGNRATLYGTCASIVGSLLGFAITVMSIMFTVAEGAALKLVRESAHYQTLWKTYTSAIRVLGLSTVVTVIALIIDRDTKPRPYVLYFVVFLALLAIARVWRSIRILELIIRVIAPPSTAPTPSRSRP
jgi:hypothetical protein